jgi:hypothetical protein
MHLTPSNVTIFAPKPIPLRVGTPVLWFDPADANTIMRDSSNNVERYNSKGNIAVPIGQSSPTRRPGISSIKGVPALSFDGIDDALVTSSPFSVVSHPSTHVAVFRPNTTGAQSAIFDVVSGGSGRQLIHRDALGRIIQFAGILVTHTTFSVPANQTSVVVAVFNGASSYIRLDGVQSGNVNAGAQTISTYRLGLGQEDTINPFSGLMAETLLYSRELTGGELASIEAYLKAKWGTP